MNTIFAIAAGGAMGAILRYGADTGSAYLFGSGFPWGTLIVNVFGSFVMGLLIASFTLMGNPSQEMKAFLIVGLLGSMTTFSAFSLDVVTLFERGDVVGMSVYMFGSIFISIMALFAGLFIVRNLLV